MAIRKSRTAHGPRGRGSARETLQAELESSDAFRRVTAFCDRLRRGKLRQDDLDRLVAADAAVSGLTHTEDLAERRAAAVALVGKALPRLDTVEGLDRLLERLAQKVDPRFGRLRVAAKRRRQQPVHLAPDLETITQPRWGAIRATAWLALRSGALPGRRDPQPRTLEYILPQLYADELALRKQRQKQRAAKNTARGRSGPRRGKARGG